jgi:hypothetical protein
MFTYNLIIVAWGGDARVAINLMLQGCQNIGKVPLQKSAAFICLDPKSVKILSSCQYLFVLLASSHT